MKDNKLTLLGVPYSLVEKKYLNELIRVSCMECLDKNLFISKSQDLSLKNAIKNKEFKEYEILCLECCSKKQEEEFTCSDLREFYDINSGQTYGGGFKPTELAKKKYQDILSKAKKAKELENRLYKVKNES